MSIVQGGSGFPFLAEAVYAFLCTNKCFGVMVNTDSVPYPTLLPLLNEVMFFFRCVHESNLLSVYRFWVHPLMLTFNRSSCVRSMKPCYSRRALSHSASWSWVMWKLFERAYRLPLHRESQSINGPIQERTRPCWTVQISEVTPRWTEADVCSQHEYSTHTRYFVLWCPVLILVWSIDRMFFNRFVQVPAYSPLYIKGECSSHSQIGGGSLYSLRWLLGSVCR